MRPTLDFQMAHLDCLTLFAHVVKRSRAEHVFSGGHSDTTSTFYIFLQVALAKIASHSAFCIASTYYYSKQWVFPV